MGYGRWRENDFRRYSSAAGRSIRDDGSIDTTAYGGSAQKMYSQRGIAAELNPYKVIRECCETEEHPNSLPVITALDVTGSMGPAAIEVAGKLGIVMKDIYGMGKDVEFMVMGIGDLAYDRAPIQIGQFESDIRVAEQLDKIYFEGGGGGNRYESYTAAWYMAARHTKLDCLARGCRGVIITLGDEPLNPYLPQKRLEELTGDRLQGDVETADLLREVRERYEVYHIFVRHGGNYYEAEARKSFGKYLDRKHLYFCRVEEIAKTITDIVNREQKRSDGERFLQKDTVNAAAAEDHPDENENIAWNEAVKEGKEGEPGRKGFLGFLQSIAW